MRSTWLYALIFSLGSLAEVSTTLALDPPPSPIQTAPMIHRDPTIVKMLRSARSGQILCWKLTNAPLDLHSLCYVDRGHFLFTSKGGDELLEIQFSSGKDLIYFRNPETKDIWLRMYLHADEDDETNPYFVVQQENSELIGQVKRVTETSSNNLTYVFINPSRRVDAKLNHFILKEKPDQKKNWKITSYYPEATTSTAVLLGIAGIQSVFAEIMARGKKLPPGAVENPGFFQKNSWLTEAFGIAGFSIITGLAAGVGYNKFFGSQPTTPPADESASPAPGSHVPVNGGVLLGGAIPAPGGVSVAPSFENAPVPALGLTAAPLPAPDSAPASAVPGTALASGSSPSSAPIVPARPLMPARPPAANHQPPVASSRAPVAAHPWPANPAPSAPTQSAVNDAYPLVSQHDSENIEPFDDGFGENRYGQLLDHPHGRFDRRPPGPPASMYPSFQQPGPLNIPHVFAADGVPKSRSVSNAGFRYSLANGGPRNMDRQMAGGLIGQSNAIVRLQLLTKLADPRRGNFVILLKSVPRGPSITFNVEPSDPSLGGQPVPYELSSEGPIDTHYHTFEFSLDNRHIIEALANAREVNFICPDGSVVTFQLG